MREVINFIKKIPNKAFNWFRNTFTEVSAGEKGVGFKTRGTSEPTNIDFENIARYQLSQYFGEHSFTQMQLEYVISLLKLDYQPKGDIFDSLSKAKNHIISGIYSQQSLNVLGTVFESWKYYDIEKSDKPNFGSTKFLTIFDKIKNNSDENVRDLWAKLIAGEITNKGSFSLITIDALSKITSDDIATLKEIIIYASNGGLLLDDYWDYKKIPGKDDLFNDIEGIFNTDVAQTTDYDSLSDFYSSRLFKNAYTNGVIRLMFCHGALQIKVDDDLVKINKVSRKLANLNWIKFSELAPLVPPDKIDILDKFPKFLDFLSKEGLNYEYQSFCGN